MFHKTVVIQLYGSSFIAVYTGLLQIEEKLVWIAVHCNMTVVGYYSSIRKACIAIFIAFFTFIFAYDYIVYVKISAHSRNVFFKGFDERGAFHGLSFAEMVIEKLLNVVY